MGLVVVRPNDVPAFLLERRTRLLRHNHLPRFEGIVPHYMKERVLAEVIRRHYDDLKPFFSPGVLLIGGKTGDKATRAMVRRFAELKHEKWGAKDGYDGEGKYAYGAKDYFNLMWQREKHGGVTPAFVQMNGKASIAGAVFPIQVNTEDVTTHAHMISNHTYSLDTITGSVLACPIICSNGSVKGTGKALIVDGVLQYAAILAYFRYIDDLIAYSRPAEYGPEKRHIPITEHLPTDANFVKLHNRNGARVVCIVDGGSGAEDRNAGGYGFIAGYTTHLKPGEAMLATLKKIEKTVRGIIR